MTSVLCLTCSAPLSAIVPSSSEKPLPPPLGLACGRHSICGQCQLRSARYARGNQRCLLCTDAKSLLAGPAADQSVESREFVLGGDEDDDDELPPAYEDRLEAPPAINDDKVLDKEDGERNSIHHVRPDETLAGLALKYRVPGPILCRLNRLPLSTLNTTPQLIHTRPFLVLPPHAKSTSTEPVRTEEEERKRLNIRRFQMETKATYEVAKAYLDTVYDDRRKEIEIVNANRTARGDAVVDGPRTGGELDEAVSRWKADEQWEREQSNKNTRNGLRTGRA